MRLARRLPAVASKRVQQRRHLVSVTLRRLLIRLLCDVRLSAKKQHRYRQGKFWVKEEQILLYLTPPRTLEVHPPPPKFT